MELFTNFEIMIMVSVVGFLVFVILLLTVIEILSKRKEKRKTKIENIETTNEEELNDLDVEEQENDDLDLGQIEVCKEESKEEEKEDYLMEFTSNIETLKEELFEENEIKEEAVEIQKEIIKEPQEEEILIEDLDEPIPSPNNLEIEVLELEPPKASLELLKIEEELKHPMSLEDTISSLEKEEEESAIISYQELLDVTQEMQVIEDLEDEPISITEVYERFTGESVEHPSIDDLYQASLVNQESDLNEIQLENTANLEKLDKEIRKTNKVLNMLNELKKNLD